MIYEHYKNLWRTMVNALAKQLNVTHLLGFPIDFNGNLQRALFEANCAARYGARVKILASKKAIDKVLLDSISKKYLNSNIEIFPLKSLMPMGAPHSTTWLNLGWRVNNLIALPTEAYKFAEDETILHVHAPTPVTKPFSSSFFKKLLKKPMVLDLHDPWSGHPFPVLGCLDLLLRNALMKYAINSADFIVVAHTALGYLVKRINPKKRVDLVPNSVDAEFFRPKPRDPLIAGKVGIDEHDFVVAFSGHVTEEKGLDVLVQCASIVAKECKEIKFLVIGDGPFMNNVKALVNNSGLRRKFCFTGFVSKGDLINYLSLADICVAPYAPGPWYEVSRVETPIKVVEYMAMEKPVVMSRISEENVITWSGGGLLITPGDVSELALSIIKLAKDEKLRKRMGKKGRKYIEDKLSWQAIARKLMRIYQSLSEHD
jgi:glycosyltransferase involved in cell wall biosynthesis